MAYSLLKGVRLGFLPESYRAYGEKAIDGICKRYLKEKNGEMSLVVFVWLPDLAVKTIVRVHMIIIVRTGCRR